MTDKEKALRAAITRILSGYLLDDPWLEDTVNKIMLEVKIRTVI